MDKEYDDEEFLEEIYQEFCKDMYEAPDPEYIIKDYNSVIPQQICRTYQATPDEEIHPFYKYRDTRSRYIPDTDADNDMMKNMRVRNRMNTIIEENETLIKEELRPKVHWRIPSKKERGRVHTMKRH